MSNAAVTVRGLGKQYRLGQREQYRVLRDVIAGAAVSGLRRLGQGGPRSGARTDRSWLWALDDVSFDVRHGEVMGLIGRNGSGKTTLLKILSRVTEPTRGYADVTGRVGALLEVGTGFHPELTGRENIYLNGAILGMKRADIRRRFDDIVAFAELERFVDTPVKRYSSGMYVRLAFSVAAHLEPDILLVDEVLAVGDAAFRKRCLGKMGDVAREGRTVVFVSHDMTNISVLCDTALLLAQGRVKQYGAAAEVVESYLNAEASRPSQVAWESGDGPGDEGVRITGVAVRTSSGQSGDVHPLSEPIRLELEYRVQHDGLQINPVFGVRNSLGTLVFSTANYDDPVWGERCYQPGRYKAECVVPGHFLNEGVYGADAMLIENASSARARAEGAIEWSVYDDGLTRGGYVGSWEGVVRPTCGWRVTEL